MQKNRVNPFEKSGEGCPQIAASILRRFTSEEGMMMVGMMTELIDNGLTPVEFEAFYEIYRIVREVSGKDKPAKSKKKAARKAVSRNSSSDSRTYLLKIQMKGVSKPPMWREVEIASHASFLALHHVIQVVMGLENCHLWQFNRKAYDDELQIGIEMGEDEFSDGLDYITDDAATTPISDYFNEEGHTLEYTYDFGDDWIFTVTLKKVLDKECENPVCTGFKSSLNALEDMGGIWAYETCRRALETWDSLSKKGRREITDEYGFDTPDDFKEYLDEHLFNMQEVNRVLKIAAALDDSPVGPEA